MKKLLIISHTPHVFNSGKSYGWGPTVKEINFLSNYFQIEHIAPVHRLTEVPKSFLQVVEKVRLIPTRDRGGKTVFAKLRVTFDSIQYASLILWRIRHCDLVHVRCPSNISLVALIVLLFLFRKPKWIKYAGDWHPKQDYLSYWLQRFLIRNFIVNQVATVNDISEGNPTIFHSFNPSYSLSELHGINSQQKPQWPNQMNILFVGSLSKNKGVDLLIEGIRITLNQLGKAPGMQVKIIGDGPELVRLKELTEKYQLNEVINFEGWKSGNELKEYYCNAHLIVLPSRGEGWPKVISEAMAYGVVPIVSDVSSIKEILKSFEVGTVVTDFLPATYSKAVRGYVENPSKWTSESSKAMTTVINFTYEHWATRLFKLFEEQLSFKVTPNDPQQGGRVSQ